MAQFENRFTFTEFLIAGNSGKIVVTKQAPAETDCRAQKKHPGARNDLVLLVIISIFLIYGQFFKSLISNKASYFLFRGW